MKRIKTGYILLFIFITAAYIFCSFLKTGEYSSLIYPGVKIQGIDLSGKTKQEAYDLINQSYINKITGKKINVYSEKSKKTYTLNYNKLKFMFDLEDCLNKAYSYGKYDSFIERIFRVNFSSCNYELHYTYDKKAVEDFSSAILAAETKQPVNASMVVNNDELNVLKEVQGYMPDTALLLKELFQDINCQGEVDKIINIVFNPLIPKITSDTLKGINKKISTFSTAYLGISSPERCNNIELAVKSINGKVIMPGEIFSYNETVGERTAVKGYKNAPVIENGKMVYGLGGGICQVSTTLYNAAIKAGLDIVERNHHSLPVHYISSGMDATVDYGNLDLKFKNNKKYPIYIQGITIDGKIIFNLYSNNS